MTSTLSLTKTVTHSASGITNPRAELDLTGVNGTQSLTYNYLKHANASFVSGVDTNVLTQELNDNPFNFSIFNLGDADTAAMDSISFGCSGDCSAFKLSLSSIQNLGAGSHFAGFVDENYYDVVGNYEATYTFLFSDDTSVGATSTHKQNTLFLTVSGSVAAIPEPGTIALVLAGLSIIGTRRRNQQTNS